MPLDQAVLDHQVVGGVPAEEGAPAQVDVVVVAARREMILALLEPLRSAGLEPVGVDLSAFGMIRALGSATPAGGERRPPGQQASATPLLPRRRRHQPRRRQGRLLPLHPGLPRRPRGHRRAAGGRHGLTLEHAHQWLSHVGLAQPLEKIEGDRDRRPRPRGARGGRRRPARRAADSRSTTTAPRRAPSRRQVVLCGPGSAIPGLAEQMERCSACRSRSAAPTRCRLRRRLRRPPDPFLRPRPGELTMRPVNLIPPERAPRRATAAARRPRSPTSSSAPWSPPSSG